MKVEAWMVLKGKPRAWGQLIQTGPYKGNMPLDKVTIVRTTVNKPALGDDEICFRIDLEVPEELFMDPTGTIKIDVPLPTSSANIIQAQVDMPVVKGRGKSAAASIINATTGTNTSVPPPK